MSYPAKRKHSGFTLIELLVVVAIISLLVSILIPSLAKAKDLARTMMCQTNLKGIGLLAEMYRNDYKGYLPYMPRGMDTINTDAERKQTWQYRLMEYNDMASNVFDCPSDPRSNYMGSLYGPADYGVNAAYMEGVGGKMSPENPKRWGDPFLRAPEDILYVVDSECSFLYIWASTFGSRHLVPCHDSGTGANVLCLDLHVEGPTTDEVWSNGADVGNPAYVDYVYPQGAK